MAVFALVVEISAWGLGFRNFDLRVSARVGCEGLWDHCLASSAVHLGLLGGPFDLVSRVSKVGYGGPKP